jgi:phosphoribosylformimino-5-aminoimidazole carboxamide ribotide isomerase
MCIVIPAIDIHKGKCVRLTQGLIDSRTVYYENPLDALKFWEGEGATRLHIVDLDGAFGSGSNYKLIKEMVLKTFIKLQVGGGIRSIESAEKLKNLGVDRIVIGTAALKNPDFIEKLSNSVEKSSIIVAIDMKNNKPAIKGWTETIDTDVFKMGRIVEEKGAGHILFSSVESDGTFSGPDLLNIKKMTETVKIPIIAAGGVRNMDDVINLKKIGVKGVIIGKAFYENRMKFSDVKNL